MVKIFRGKCRFCTCRFFEFGLYVKCWGVILWITPHYLIWSCFVSTIWLIRLRSACVAHWILNRMVCKKFYGRCKSGNFNVKSCRERFSKRKKQQIAQNVVCLQKMTKKRIKNGKKLSTSKSVEISKKMSYTPSYTRYPQKKSKINRFT